MSCHSFLVYRVSAERSAVNLMGIPLCVICCFSLAAFNMFSFYLTFDSLINMCCGMFLLGFFLYGTLCASWTWLTISIPILGMFSTIVSSNIFWVPFYFSSSSETVHNSFHSFIFFLLSSRYFHYFIFQVTYPFFCLSFLLLIPSREFLISFFVLFIFVCLLFSSSRFLLNVSCHFSILFPRLWIIFTIIILNSFSGRLPISSSFVRPGGFLPCSFICCVFLCLLILLNLLCLGSSFAGCRFLVPIIFGFCPQWLRLVQWIVYASWWRGLVPVF